MDVLTRQTSQPFDPVNDVLDYILEVRALVPGRASLFSMEDTAQNSGVDFAGATDEDVLLFCKVGTGKSLLS